MTFIALVGHPGYCPLCAVSVCVHSNVHVFSAIFTFVWRNLTPALPSKCKEVNISGCNHTTLHTSLDFSLWILISGSGLVRFNTSKWDKTNHISNKFQCYYHHLPHTPYRLENVKRVKQSSPVWKNKTL